MIARPIRRTGPIPFAPFPPLADRPLMAAPRETRDIRETRLRSRWLPTPHTGHPMLSSAPSTVPSAAQTSAQQVLIQAARHDGGTRSSAALAASNASPEATVIAPRTPRGGCHAVYHGQGTLSVLSSITGHHYRFEGRGCTLTIDPRDRLVLGRLNELSIHSASS